MSDVAIRKNARVLVADGRKAIVFRNDGIPQSLKLTVEQVVEAEPNPATREQGTDRPGRAAMGSHRSSMGQADMHDAEEQRFIQRVAEALGEVCSQQAVPAVILVAAPRALAELRKAVPASVQNLVVAEIAKDLVNLPIADIEKRLS